MLHQSFDVNGDIASKFSQEIENEKLIYFSQTVIKIVKIINHFHLVFLRLLTLVEFPIHLGCRHSFLTLLAHYVCKRCLALWQTPPPQNLRYKWVVQQSFNIIDRVSVHQTSRGVYSVTLHCTGFVGLNDQSSKNLCYHQESLNKKVAGSHHIHIHIKTMTLLMIHFVWPQ